LPPSVDDIDKFTNIAPQERAMDIEFETGTYVRSAPRRHNGYWAGDFTDAPPVSWEQLRRVMALARPTDVRALLPG
jgi:hypothetical protein